MSNEHITDEREAIADAGFAALEARGFKLNHSDIGVSDLLAIFDAMCTAAQGAYGTTYTLIAYRPDGVDTCRNCVMGRSPSDFELNVFKTQDDLVTAWAKAAAEAPEGYEYSETEFTLLLNGLSSDQDYDDDTAYREREQIQTRVSAETQRLKAIKLEAAQAAEKAAKRAEEDRREAAERKQLAELQQKYGAKR